MGSPYVPLDSWIYPALERLAALGYVDSGIAGMRPWTRMECARQVSEASDRIVEDDLDKAKELRIYPELLKSFAAKSICLGAGTTLKSAWNQPIREVRRSLANRLPTAIILDKPSRMILAVLRSRALTMFRDCQDGPRTAHLQFMFAANISILPRRLLCRLAARDAISQADFGLSFAPLPPGGYPVPPDTPTPATDRGRLLDSYVAMNISDWQLSYGKQSLWWGPSAGGGMMLSDGADPLTMFRINRVTPIASGLLGEIRERVFHWAVFGIPVHVQPFGSGRPVWPVPPSAADRPRRKIQLEANKEFRVWPVADDRLWWTRLSLDLTHISPKRIFDQHHCSGRGQQAWSAAIRPRFQL